MQQLFEESRKYVCVFKLIKKKIIASSGWFVATHHGRGLEHARRACPGYCWRQMCRLKATEPRRVICVV